MVHYILLSASVRSWQFALSEMHMICIVCFRVTPGRSISCLIFPSSALLLLVKHLSNISWYSAAVDLPWILLHSGIGTDWILQCRRK